MADLDLGFIAITFTVLIASLTFHEAAHAWTANLLGDPTARKLGRLSLNPAVHIDPIGTVLFPLIAIVTGMPLIGWAKPVPVDMRNLKSPRRDFAIVALGLCAISMPRRYDLRVTADSILLAARRTCSGWDASVKLSSSVIA